MTERPTRIRYRIVVWLTVAASLAYLCRNAVGVAESSIRRDLGLTLEQSGWFMAAFFWVYAFFQIPSGWLTQKYGTRASLCVFAILWSIATLIMGIAPGFWLLILAQMLMGAAQAGLFPASCVSIGQWMPLSQRSLGSGFVTAGMQVGAIVAAALTGALMASLGWRNEFILFAIPGVIWAIAFYIRFRNTPEESPNVNAEELKLIRQRDESPGSDSASAEHEHLSWSQLLRNVDLWLICGQQVCRAGAYIFFASWFPTFLQSTRGVSVEASGYLQGIVLAGVLVGNVVGGAVTDWVWKKTGSLRLSRCGVGAASLGTCGLLVLGAWFVEDARLAVCLLSLGSFASGFAGPCTFAAIIEISGNRVAEVFGLVNMAGNIAAAGCPIIVAKIFSVTANWNLVLILFAILYLTGAACWALANPGRHCRSQMSHPEPMTNPLDNISETLPDPASRSC